MFALVKQPQLGSTHASARALCQAKLALLVDLIYGLFKAGHLTQHRIHSAGARCLGNDTSADHAVALAVIVQLLPNPKQQQFTYPVVLPESVPSNVLVKK